MDAYGATRGLVFGGRHGTISHLGSEHPSGALCLGRRSAVKQAQSCYQRLQRLFINHSKRELIYLISCSYYRNLKSNAHCILSRCPLRAHLGNLALNLQRSLSPLIGSSTQKADGGGEAIDGKWQSVNCLDGLDETLLTTLRSKCSEEGMRLTLCIFIPR